MYTETPLTAEISRDIKSIFSHYDCDSDNELTKFEFKLAFTVLMGYEPSKVLPIVFNSI
jgi:Ca2+-binding EF-hand superfamily protein